jgi:hypothetical protein
MVFGLTNVRCCPDNQVNALNEQAFYEYIPDPRGMWYFAVLMSFRPYLFLNSILLHDRLNDRPSQLNHIRVYLSKITSKMT